MYGGVRDTQLVQQVALVCVLIRYKSLDVKTFYEQVCCSNDIILL